MAWDSACASAMPVGRGRLFAPARLPLLVSFCCLGGAALDASSLPWYAASGRDDGTGGLEDVSQSCDVDAVQSANMAQLHPILRDLADTTFFRMFHVNLRHPECPFWEQPQKDEKDLAKDASGGGSCTGGAGPSSPFAAANAAFGSFGRGGESSWGGLKPMNL